ncbi:MAG: DUF58 domain-containing protein [Myxococcales bacterium]|nr:DUF58 domain-containing protein [Myxococcales bacterium]MCB9642067.1 DUF58 domain-containing protein [Myxococcales bacterium]
MNYKAPYVDQLPNKIPEGAGIPLPSELRFTARGVWLLVLCAALALWGSMRASWLLLGSGLLGWTVLFLIWLQHRMDLENNLHPRHLRLSWKFADQSYRAGHDASLSVEMTPASAPLFLQDFSLRHSVYLHSSIPPQTLKRRTLSPRKPHRITFKLNTPVMGDFPLYGVDLTFSDRFRFFEHQRYLRLPEVLRVMPVLPLANIQRKGVSTRPLRAVTNGLPQHRPGSGSELHDIREYRPGDARRSIVWKHSLRLRKLLCRDFESETPMTVYTLLDIGQSMREGTLSQRKIDHATQVAIAFSKSALGQQDRVGLISFDGEILEHVHHDRGKTQLHRILKHLQTLHHLTDPRFSELSLSELFTLTSGFLYREGFLAAPSGRAPCAARPMLHYLWEIIRKHPDLHFPDSWKSDEDLVIKVLRTIVDHMGIELPYRYHQWATQKAAGLATALEEAVRSMHGGQLIVVLSDLNDILHWDRVMQALRLARQHRHHVIFLSPFSPWFAIQQPEKDPTMAVLQELLTLEQWSWRRRIQRMIGRLGYSLLSVDPKEAPLLLSERLQKLRQGGRF